LAEPAAQLNAEYAREYIRRDRPFAGQRRTGQVRLVDLCRARGRLMIHQTLGGPDY
jgi:hypothetical protein